MTATALIETLEVKADGGLGPMPIFGVTSLLSEVDEERSCRIAEAAYFKAMARGFEPGHEVEDWLEAEAEQLT